MLVYIRWAIDVMRLLLDVVLLLIDVIWLYIMLYGCYQMHSRWCISHVTRHINIYILLRQ